MEQQLKFYAVAGHEAPCAAKNIPLYILVLLCALGACSNEPSLDETLAWMDGVYNNHLNEGGDRGHGVWMFDKPFGREESSFKSRECEFIIIHSEIGVKSTFSSQTKFNLKNVDFNSVEFSKYWNSGANSSECDDSSSNLALFPNKCDIAKVSFASTNNNPSFEYLVTNDLAKIYKPYINKSYFLFDNVAIGGRFAKAFRHAVDLCGGQPGPF